MEGNKMEQGKRKLLSGVVVKDKMDKTRVVEVTRMFRHAMYEKVLKRRKKYHMHDEKNESHVGDKVIMMESRPLSRTKRWYLVKIAEKTKKAGA